MSSAGGEPAELLIEGASGTGERRYAHYLLGLIALGLLARVLVVAVTWDFHPRVDNFGYVLRAVYFWEYSGHLMPAYAPPGGKVIPDAWWPPGYPIFLVGLLAVHEALHAVGLLGSMPIAIAGKRFEVTNPESLFQFLRLLTSILGVVIVPLVAWIVKAMMGRRIALVAAALIAVYPPLLIVGASLFSESLFLPLLALAIVCVIKLAQGGGWRWALAAGLVFGLAALVHSDGVVLIVPLCIGAWLAVQRRSVRSSDSVAGTASDRASGESGGNAVARRRVWARALWAPVLMIAVLALTLTPWTIRNAVKFHAFIPLSSSFQPTLAGTYNPLSDHWRERPAGWIPADEAYPMLARRHYKNRLALNNAYETAAIDYIRAHPGYVVKVFYWNTRRLLELAGFKAPGGSYYTSAFEGATKTLTWVDMVSFWILALLAIGGALTGAVRRARYRWIWLMPLLAYLSTVLITTNTPRFRAVIDLFLIFAAAAAIVSLRDRFGSQGGGARGDVSPHEAERGDVSQGGVRGEAHNVVL